MSSDGNGLRSVTDTVTAFAAGRLEKWESSYLAFHGRRFAQTISLLPAPTRPDAALLDVGIFPGHLAALARERGTPSPASATRR